MVSEVRWVLIIIEELIMKVIITALTLSDNITASVALLIYSLLAGDCADLMDGRDYSIIITQPYSVFTFMLTAGLYFI